ncbi:MAG: ComF family protein [Candidatus Peribacteraceae bacterium]|nr:ComF family protein [Candidatus Peribacteraceae bacterium]
MLQIFLDLLFPRRSLTGEDGAWVTEAELRQLQSRPVILETAALRAQGLECVDRIVAVADYDAAPLLHRAVHTFKYKKVRGIGEVLGGILAETSSLLDAEVTENYELRIKNYDPVLCPVPLHWRRKFARGFNQADVLADEVGRSRGWEVQNLLKRTRWTGSQVGRHRRERLIGVNDAFAIRPRMKIPEHVILVDDLSTTGATLDACAKVLKKSGVKKVEGLVIALG